MDLGERRVRRLQLHGGGEDQLRRGRYLLEEALRTASLPGLPPGSVVLVRRLDLGRLPAGLSAPALACHIDACMRQLAAAAVCVDRQPAPRADVVWFSDPLQPCISLLQRLLDGRPLGEWYWQSLFPGRHFTLNEGCLDLLLERVRQALPQGVASAHLIQACLEPRRLERLLPLISPRLARQQLVAMGVMPADGVGQPGSASSSGGALPPGLKGGWLRALGRAAAAWGAADVRTLWLASQALLFSHPLYGGESAMLQQLRRWLPAWLADLPLAGERSKRALAAHLEGRGESGARPLQPSRPVALSSDERARAAGGGYAPEGPSPRQPLSSAAGTSSAADKSPSDSAEALSSLEAVAVGCKDSTDRAAVTENCAADGTVALTTLAAERAESGDSVGIAGAFDGEGSMVVPVSDCAGLGFVINLLQRYGLPELMVSNDSLAAHGFHLYLLRAVASRFGIKGDDPSMALFDGQADIGALVVEGLSLPKGWAAEMDHLPRRCRRLGQTASARQLMVVMQLLMGRYLRRHCRLSLRQLVRRTGRVVLSRSHWDVVFDIDQSDLRLRRLALDSDPGWVPWLGRVVQFHYDTGGARYV